MGVSGNRGMVSIVTDSSACIPDEIARGDLPLRVLPISIHLDGHVYDDTDGARQAVWEALEQGDPVKTSPVTPAAYLWASAQVGNDGVVIVTPASEFTVMHQNALRAAELVETTVEVVDTRTAAAAQGLVAIATAEVAATGASLEEVASCARAASDRVHLVAVVSSFNALRASGRVAADAIGGEELDGVVSMFRLEGGEVSRLARLPDLESALDELASLPPPEPGPGSRRVVFHAATRERAAMVRTRLGHIDHVREFSAALGVHTGSDVVGVAWIDPE